MRLTVVTKTNGSLTKTLSLQKGHIVKDSSECWLNDGTATQVDTTLEEFSKNLRKLKPNQTLIHGVNGHKSINIVSERHFKGTPDTISRTKKYFRFVEGEGSAFFDHDPKPGQPVLTYKKFIYVLSKVFPEIGEMAYVWTPSTSACIYKDGEELVGSDGGFHIYFAVKDATDLPRFSGVLFKRLWLAGHGYIFITKDGKQLPRTIFDKAVFSPERLDFVAGAICRDGLKQKLPDPVYIAGYALDTTLLSGLTENEEREYLRLIEKTKKQTAPKAEAIRGRYVKAEVDKLIQGGAAKVKARQIVGQRIGGDLISGDVLCFDRLENVTVDDVLNDPAKFDKESLRDPLEPYYGPHKAILYTNQKEDKPVIYSQAHGGRTFFLKRGTDIDNTIIQELADLSPLEYDQRRTETAEKLGVRVSTLDDEVKKFRQQGETESDAAFEEIEPWPEKVNGAELLNHIRAVISSHLVMQDCADVACALWVVMSYCFNAFRILPLLGISSPEKRCGKTTLSEVLQGLVFKPVMASNLSSAVMYRIIEAYSPALIVDEADTFLIHNDELRGVFNAGHTRKSAFVWRVNPDTLEPEQFSVWGPKAVLMIGDLPDTMKDRSVSVRMKRKTPGETVKKLTLDFDKHQLHLRRKCARWGVDNIAPLISAVPDIPNVRNDRASDNWLPLLAIADLAGGEWSELARKAMLRIEHDGMNESNSAGQMLLQDIKKFFDRTSSDRIFSDNLVEQIIEMEDRPWCEWRRGKPITQNSLSRLLKPFGIRPKNLRLNDKVKKGYELKDFQDSFDRYLSSEDIGFQTATTLQRNDFNILHGKQTATLNKSVADGEYCNYLKIKSCSGVADGNEITGRKDLESDINNESVAPIPKAIHETDNQDAELF